MQTDGKRIDLLPAWPKDWTADFKLHAPYQTTIEGHVANGKIVRLRVTPDSRAKDVLVVGEGSRPNAASRQARTHVAVVVHAQQTTLKQPMPASMPASGLYETDGIGPSSTVRERGCFQ